MIDGNAALGQQFIDIAVDRPDRRYRRIPTAITSRGNR
jgi:hypothetical protein